MKVWLVTFDSSIISTEEALTNIRSHSLISEAQFNHYVQERETYPDDPGFVNQWALENTGQSGGVPGADIDAPLAWDTCTGGVTTLGDTLVLAIIDSGNYLDHDDLNFWKNTLEIPGNDIDDDNNGYVDDYDGWNAVHHNGNVSNSSHGTHVSGIAGAIGNNGLGATGVNWGARIMPIRGSSSTESIVIEAYGYVLEMRSRYNETSGEEGAFVVATNASFGVNYGNPDNFPLWSAIYDSLGLQGVLSCGATMNINANVDQVGDMPTACESDYLISVTNTTDDDLKNNDAAYGLTTIDLGAPGTNVYSTDLSNSYSYKSGTSMACPQVTGAIGFLFSAAPPSFMQNYQNSPAEYALLIRQYLLDGVDPIEDLDGITVTGGRLNIHNSLQFFEQEPEEFEVSGNITFDTVWDADTVLVVGDIWIEDSVTVTIPSGTIVEFQENYFIDVQGTLLAEGSETDSIYFTVADTAGFSELYLETGGWGGIVFDNVDPSNDLSIFSYCVFEYGKAIENFQPTDGACFKLINSGNIDIQNSRFYYNFAGYGGAIYCDGALPYFVNNIVENSIAAYSGGAIYLENCDSAIISNNSFIQNLALQGGAIYATASNLDLRENNFSYNLTRSGQISAGGAIYLWESSALIENNIFENNISGKDGGAIYIEDNYTTPQRIANNHFVENQSAENGGSINISTTSNMEIINNLFVDSQADVGGALFLIATDSIKVFNNTISGNSSNYAAGLACYNSSNADIFNNIFWDNEAFNLADQIDISESSIEIAYNNIQDGLDGVEIGDGVEYTYENNLMSDPEFLNEGDHPYSISIRSECINTGTPDTTGLGLPQVDLEGNPRIFEGFVTNIDMGAYEFQGDNVEGNENSLPIYKRSVIINNYPNPFNPVTRINFYLNPLTTKAELKIFNILGQEIKKFEIRDNYPNGLGYILWEGLDNEGKPVPSGIYFSKLTADSQLSFRKMILLK